MHRRFILFGALAVLLVALGVWVGRTFFAPTPRRRPVVVSAPEVASKPASAESRRLPLAAARAKRAQGAIDVVLVVWDTVRRDELEPYGSKLPSSPFIAALARDGVTFTNAYSTSGWTVPAMYSLMTGLYPREHGVVQSTIVGTDQPTQVALPDEADTLAERLKRAGYATFGVNTNMHLAPRFGFAQGFDYFVGDGFHFRPFPRAAIDSLRDAILETDKYFLWLHYFDPHFPYSERQPWFHEWNDSPFAGFEEVGLRAAISDYWRDKGELPRASVPPNDVIALTRYLDSYTFDPIRLYDALLRLSTGPDNYRAQDNYGRYLRAAYRSEIRAIDADVEHVFERLGIDDGTFVVLTSDHGEEFFDHGRLGHRLDSLYEELIRIPLIVRLPGGAHRGTTVDSPVSLIDVLPSIVQLAQGEAPTDVSGRSFIDLIGSDVSRERDIVTELTYLDGSEHRALIRQPWKYIHHVRDVRDELYELSTDPGERTNRITTEPQRAGQMRQALEAWASGTTPRFPTRPPSAVHSDHVRKLRALGYTASP